MDKFSFPLVGDGHEIYLIIHHVRQTPAVRPAVQVVHVPTLEFQDVYNDGRGHTNQNLDAVCIKIRKSIVECVHV